MQQSTIVDKNLNIRKIWKSTRLYNYAFTNTILKNIISIIDPKGDLTLVYDKKLTILKEQNFIRHLDYETDSRFLDIKAVESHKEPCIWAADFLSGAAYYHFARDDSTYYDRLDKNNLIGNGIRKIS
jgi:hypothetical protein